MRQDPDVILIGEMRDEETSPPRSAPPRPATSSSTVHTIDAIQTVSRIIDFYPPHQESLIRAMLAGN